MSDNWGSEAADNNPARFDFDAGDQSASDLTSRLTVDIPGKYHLEISEPKEKFEVTGDNGQLISPHILVPCVVLHTVPGQSPAGSFHYHRVDVAGKGGGAMEDWQVKSTLAFLLGVGLLKTEAGKVIDPATGTTHIQLATVARRLNQMQFIGDLRLEKSSDPTKYKDRICFSFGRGAFPIDAHEVRQVPKCLDALKLIGKEHCMPVAANGQAPSTSTTEKKGRGAKKEVTPASQAVSQSTALQPAVASQAPVPAEAATAANDFDDL